MDDKIAGFWLDKLRKTFSIKRESVFKKIQTLPQVEHYTL